MNICEHLTDTAKILPDKTAIVFEGQEFSYSQLDALSASAAQQLLATGVSPGDRIAV